MTLRAGTTRDWKREFISNLLLAFSFCFWVHLCFSTCSSVSLAAAAVFSSYSGGAPAVDKFPLIYMLYVTFFKLRLPFPFFSRNPNDGTRRFTVPNGGVRSVLNAAKSLKRWRLWW